MYRHSSLLARPLLLAPPPPESMTIDTLLGKGKGVSANLTKIESSSYQEQPPTLPEWEGQGELLSLPLPHLAVLVPE